MKFILDLEIETRARLACIYSGIAWGLFWIPLRMLDSAGIHDAWATVLFYLVPLFFFLPYTILHWNKILRGGLQLHLIGLATGPSRAISMSLLAIFFSK